MTYLKLQKTKENITVADYIGEFREASNNADEIKRQRDFDDLQIELSGADVGRMSRFLSPEARDALRENKGLGGKHSNAVLSALDLMLLNNPEYLRVYEGAMEALSNAETNIDRALSEAMAEANEAQKAFDELVDDAMHLPDGHAVFLDQFGIARDEDGEIIDPVLAATLEWQGKEPSYEMFVEQRNQLNSANLKVQTARYDQLKIGEIRAELTDEDNPPTKERVEEIQTEIGDINASYQASPVQPTQDQSRSFPTEKLEF